MSFFGNEKLFVDRIDAGRKLSEKLLHLKSENPLILALPRGGVPVGFEVAKALESTLDVFVVRKIGAPINPEFGIGAIAEGGVLYLDKKNILSLGISQKDLLKVINNEEAEVQRRALLYRSGKPLSDITRRIVLLVDDGLATGVTAKAAIKALNLKNPKHIYFAAPVCARETTNELKMKTASVICVATPQDLSAIGIYYEKFEQTTDEEVVEILNKASQV